MTPAIKLLDKKKINYKLHSYQHDAGCSAYGEEAAMLLGQSTNQVFKTLLVCQCDKPQQLAVAIVPVANHLDLKKIAAALKWKKVEMADPQLAQKVTGYVVGGISPIGQKKRLPTIIDKSAANFKAIYVSAGKRGLEIELQVEDLSAVCRAQHFDIAKERLY